MDNTTTEKMLHQALKLYDLTQPEAEFIRHNENITYMINDIDKKYLLRIHKPADGFLPNNYADYSRDELIQNEIEIILSLKNGTNLNMQTPVTGLNGNFVQTVSDNIPVTLLEWVEGKTVQAVETTPELLFNGGKMIAEMHSFFISTTAINYKRYNYDQTILSKIAEGVENGARMNIIKREQVIIISAALDEMRIRFDELDNLQEKHIIHADLSKSNMIVDRNGRLTPIDFSLCGYGHFYMDINMFNNDIRFSHDIIEGYKSVRKCEITPYFMEPYVALGMLLFIGCQYERAAKDMDWIPEMIKNRCCDVFEPLANKTNFIKI